MKKRFTGAKSILFILFFAVISLLKPMNLQAQAILVQPVPLSICSCEPLIVNYNAVGIFNLGNTFLVELSDATGSFASPTVIGSLVGNAANGAIPSVMPCNTPYGTGYRIRVSSTSPVVTGTDNGIDITVNPSPQVSIALTNGNCVDTLTAIVPPPNIGVQQGAKYYITTSPPWGSASNVNEMNNVFGVGNWIQANFFVNPAVVFSPGTQFVFLEGSDGNGLDLDIFVSANITLIEGWVNAGGRLFLNAAPNIGGVQNWGFGGTQLNYQNLIPAIPNNVPGVNVTNMAHPINTGPFLPLDPGGVYTANYFAHADIINGGTTLIHSSANPALSVLSEKVWGAGLVLFGGMTSTDYHNNVVPLVNAHAVNLRENILNYTAGTAIAPAITYTYLWSTGDTSKQILPVLTGIYTVTVTSSNGCTGTATYNYVAPSLLTVSITASTAPSCSPGCDGTATTNTTGGLPAYNYTISGGALINGAGFASNICAGIQYTITATDANGCTGTTTLQFAAMNAPTLVVNNQTNVSCFGNCDGTLTVTANGGLGAYNFTINPAATQGPAGTFTGLCAGAYVVTVTDANGCTGTTNINITQPPLLTLNVTAFTNVTVFGGNDGSITVNAAGGSPAYVYSILPATGNQAPAGNFINLSGQQCYTITVTDANGCTATTTQCITEPTPINLSLAATDESCFGNCDGTITATLTGGLTPYNYVLTPGNIANGTGIYTNLCPGTYTVTITDANNNTASAATTINGSTQIIFNTAVATNINCFGAPDGVINVNASGGVGIITYTINPSGPQANINGVFTSLTAQCYTVTATDANGCSNSTTLCITQPGLFGLGAAVIQNNSCFGDANGSITIQAIGGNPVPAYTYVLTPGGQSNQTGVFAGLQAGTYSVTVTDGNGCTAGSSGIIISQPPSVTFNTVNLHEVYCFGESTGSVAVVAGGGNGPVTFSISPNATQFPLGFFKDLAAGAYVITATDGNGCSVQTSINILQNPKLTITSLTVVEPICAYDTTGVFSVTATGGMAPLLYSLNNGIPQNTGTFTGLPVGNYKITLIDNLGCSIDTVLVLSGPSPVGASIQIVDTKCIDSKDGRLIVSGTGGHGGYKYYVTPGLNINKTGYFYDLAAGTYTLRVVDTIGCEYMTTFKIDPPANPLSNSITKIDLNCNGKGNEGSATANVFGGQPPYVYEWSTSPVQNTASVNALYYGWYHLLVADANGCEYRDSVYIEEGPCCDVTFIPNAFSPNGDGNNDEFKVFSTAGIQLIQLEIYDRWGQRLWSSSDYKRGWDGTTDGKQAPVSTYFYVFRYSCTRDGKTYTKKGDVTLIR